jgi:hypothetical protein
MMLAVPETTVVDMTPERAEQLLAANTRNRKLKPDAVKFYAAQMRAGLWRLTHQGIAVACDGVIVDGQHRLHGVVEAGVTVPMLLTTGLAPETMAVVDTGIKRNFADIIKMNFPEVAQRFNVAAAVAMIHRWEAGARGNDLAGVGSGAVRYRADNQTLLAFYAARRAEFGYYVAEANKMRRARPHFGCPSSVMALAVYLFEGIDYDDARDFFEKLRTGAGLGQDHPILAVLRYAERVANTRDQKPGNDIWAAILIKAWNRYRAGDTWNAATYRKGGAAPESFPEPR